MRATVASRPDLGQTDGARVLLRFVPEIAAAERQLHRLGRIGSDHLSLFDTDEVHRDSLTIKNAFTGFVEQSINPPSGGPPLRVRPVTLTPTTGLANVLGEGPHEGLLFEVQAEVEEGEEPRYMSLALVLQVVRRPGPEKSDGFMLSLDVLDYAAYPDGRTVIRHRRTIKILANRVLPGLSSLNLFSRAPRSTGVFSDEQAAAEVVGRELEAILDQRTGSSHTSADNAAGPSRVVPIKSIESRAAVLSSVIAFVREASASRLREQGRAPTFDVSAPGKHVFDPGEPTRPLLSDYSGVRLPSILGGVDATGWIQYTILAAATLAVVLLAFMLLLRAWGVDENNSRMASVPLVLANFLASTLVLLGFCGTLLGITLALDAGRLLNSTDEAIRLNANNRVFGALAVAFFTSMVGIASERVVEFVRTLSRDAGRREPPVSVVMSDNTQDER